MWVRAHNAGIMRGVFSVLGAHGAPGSRWIINFFIEIRRARFLRHAPKIPNGFNTCLRPRRMTSLSGVLFIAQRVKNTPNKARLIKNLKVTCGTSLPPLGVNRKFARNCGASCSKHICANLMNSCICWMRTGETTHRQYPPASELLSAFRALCVHCWQQPILFPQTRQPLNLFTRNLQVHLTIA